MDTAAVWKPVRKIPLDVVPVASEVEHPGPFSREFLRRYLGH